MIDQLVFEWARNILKYFIDPIDTLEHFFMAEHREKCHFNKQTGVNICNCVWL